MGRGKTKINDTVGLPTPTHPPGQRASRSSDNLFFISARRTEVRGDGEAAKVDDGDGAIGIGGVGDENNGGRGQAHLDIEGAAMRKYGARLRRREGRGLIARRWQRRRSKAGRTERRKKGTGQEEQ